MSEGKRPVQEFRYFPVRVSIWENESEEGRTFYTATLTRLYKQKGKWKSTTSLNADDLLLAAKVLNVADSWIRDQQQIARDERQEREAIQAADDF